MTAEKRPTVEERWRPPLASDKEAPSIIYHYTDAPGLLGIVNTRELWATDLAYVNDSREFVHAFDLVIRLVAELAEGRAPSAAIVSALDHVLKSVRKIMRINVACYCEEGDLLSQWRGYGSGSGYALGFDSSVLQSHLESSVDLPLAPVIYREADQLSALSKVAGPSLEPFIEYVGEVARFVWSTGGSAEQAPVTMPEMNLLPLLGVCFQLKDSSFFEEQEWRSCDVGTAKPGGSMRFRATRAGLIPYKPFMLADEQGRIGALREVVVGPGAGSDLRKTAIEMMLLELGYDGVEVRPSVIPFREL